MRISTADLNKVAASSIPSQRLLKAAISGLIAASGMSACDDNSSDSALNSSDELNNEELKSLCAEMVKQDKSTENAVKTGSDSKTEAKEEDLDVVCKDKVEEAKKSAKPDVEMVCADSVKKAFEDGKKSVAKPDVEMVCADTVKTAVEEATRPKPYDEKTTNAEQKEYTFAQLTTLCDERGGYTEIHAACGGQNSCKGFSYGDWGPGAAVLSEHSCTGANGCLGLSCVDGVAGRFGDKSGAELYAQEFGDAEPHDCLGCHAETLDPNDHSKKDVTKFFVWVMPGSTRTAENWLDLPAAEQERKVFFGAHYTDGQGRQIQNMAAYRQVLSRKEVERVVAHIRTLTPIVRTTKVVDP